jgi:site-specific DNA-cytosine methylase
LKSFNFDKAVYNEVHEANMKVAILCEFSGIVRDAFAEKGHEAISFDLLTTEKPGLHVQKDIMEFPKEYWEQYDLIIAHPPCTHLAVSGARWFNEKQEEQKEALDFVKYILDLPVPRIALENPISIISTHIRKPDQIIQPWMFGHGETKSTCLWLKNLPKLVPTNIVEGREARIHKCSPGPERWKERSRTYTGIAEAMAEQWNNLNEIQITLENYIKA